MVLQARKSILVVDDESDIVTIIEMFLRKSGKAVKGFTDPKLALEHFRQNANDYDTVLTDIRMPEMTGFELVRKLAEINPQLRVFMPSIKIENLIVKPVSMHTLLNLIEA